MRGEGGGPLELKSLVSTHVPLNIPCSKSQECGVGEEKKHTKIKKKL